jgi:hypothetical protein
MLCLADEPPSGRIKFLGRLARQHSVALLSSPTDYSAPSAAPTTPPPSPSPSPYTAPPPSPTRSSCSDTSSAEIPLLVYPSGPYVEGEGDSVDHSLAFGSSQETIVTADSELSQLSDANDSRPSTPLERSSSQESICSLAVEPSLSQTSNVPSGHNGHVFSCASDLRASVAPLAFADELALYELHENLSCWFSEEERIRGHTLSGLPILATGESLEAFEVRKDIWARGSLKSLQRYNDLLLE